MVAWHEICEEASDVALESSDDIQVHSISMIWHHNMNVDNVLDYVLVQVGYSGGRGNVNCASVPRRR